VGVPIADDDTSNVSKVDNRLVHIQADNHGGIEVQRTRQGL
jgi:hypothetical protein